MLLHTRLGTAESGSGLGPLDAGGEPSDGEIAEVGGILAVLCAEDEPMAAPSDEYELLLAAPNATEAKLAQNLLETASTPSLLHGMDRDFAGLGAALHMSVARQDLYVPKGALEDARAVLDEAWGNRDE